MTRFIFDTPINDGKRLHGMLTVSGLADGRDIEIEKIIYKQQSNPNMKTDITYLVEEFSPVLYDQLLDMAENDVAIDEPDYTLENQ
jgi:hypothetical protein